MSSVTLTIVADVAEFHITEGKPYGIADGDYMRRVPVSKIKDLSTAANEPYGFGRNELIWVEPARMWVLFQHCSYQERSMGPNEEDVYGPFLPEEQPKPPRGG